MSYNIQYYLICSRCCVTSVSQFDYCTKTSSSFDYGTKTTSPFDYGNKSTNTSGEHTHTIPQGSDGPRGWIYASGDGYTDRIHGRPPSGVAGNHSIPQGSDGPRGWIYASGDGYTDRIHGRPPSGVAGNHSHTLSIGAHRHTVGIGAHNQTVALGAHSHVIHIRGDGNAETTVKNIAFNYILRLA